jgi:hypothetical protein
MTWRVPVCHEPLRIEAPCFRNGSPSPLRRRYREWTWCAEPCTPERDPRRRRVVLTTRQGRTFAVIPRSTSHTSPRRGYLNCLIPAGRTRGRPRPRQPSARRRRSRGSRSREQYAGAAQAPPVSRDREAPRTHPRGVSRRRSREDCTSDDRCGIEHDLQPPTASLTLTLVALALPCFVPYPLSTQPRRRQRRFPSSRCERRLLKLAQEACAKPCLSYIAPCAARFC